MSFILDFLLDFIFSALSFAFSLLGGVFTDAMRIQGTEQTLFQEVLTPTGLLGNFYKMFVPGGDKLLEVFMTVGALFSYLLAMWGILKSMLIKDERLVESPISILFRMSLTSLAIVFSYKVVDIIVSIAGIFFTAFEYTKDNPLTSGVVEGGLANFGSPVGPEVPIPIPMDMGDLMTTSIIGSAYFTGFGAVGALLLLLLVIFLILILFTSFIKYMLEFFERYILLGVIAMFAPLLTATLTTAHTARYFWSWFQMLISQSIVIVLSTFFLSVFYFGMTQFETSSNVIVFTFLLMAWLRVGTRMDAHLSTLGLTTAQSGGFAGEVLAAASGFDSITRGVTGQSPTQMVANEVKALNPRHLANDVAGDRKTFAGKIRGAQLDKEMRSNGKANQTGLKSSDIEKTLKEGKNIGFAGHQAAEYLGFDPQEMAKNGQQITDGGVKDGQVYFNGLNEDGSSFRIAAKPLENGEEIPEGFVALEGEDGQSFQAQVTGDGANEFLTGTSIEDNSEDAGDVMKAFGGEENLDMEHFSGAVDDTHSGSELLNGSLGSGEFSIMDDEGNMHTVSADTQFGEMVDGQFVAEGDTFEAKTGERPMLLEEDEKGFWSQNFDKDATQTVTAQGAGFIDKDGNYVSMSKEEFAQSAITSKENASNTGSMIKDENGRYHSLAGGVVQTNSQGQVAVTDSKGDLQFITPHSSAVSTDKNGNLTYNTSKAFVQAGGKDFSDGANKSWRAVASTGQNVSEGTGVRLNDGTVAPLAASGVSATGAIKRFSQHGRESATGNYVMTQGKDGNPVLSRLSASENGGQLYKPTYAVAGGLQTDDRGRFDISQIKSVSATDTGSFIQFKNGQTAATHVPSGIKTSSAYVGSDSLGSLHTGRTQSFMENTSHLGGLSNLETLKNPAVLTKGSVTIGRESDKQHILQNMSSHSLFTNGNTKNVKAIHISPETGAISVREHNQAGFLFLPKSAYNAPKDVIGDVKIAGSDYYAVKTHVPDHQSQKNLKFGQVKMASLDREDLMDGRKALVFDSDYVERGGVESPYVKSLDELGPVLKEPIMDGIDHFGMHISPKEQAQFNYNKTSAYGLTDDFEKSVGRYERYRKNIGEAFEKTFSTGSKKPRMSDIPVGRTPLDRFMKGSS